MLEKIPISQEKLDYSVTEISSILKRVIEVNFRSVRIRGEISGVKLATSGHVYFSLKDANSNLAAVCWKGAISKLSVKLEEGLEVFCTGSITIFSSQSKYQLVVEKIELAGIGSLMALLEKRKQEYKSEGLFDLTRKKKLPFMPKTIGVVTSLSGAVIKDVLHRIKDRFPTNVIIWPVLVQGDQAAKQVSQALYGFNKIIDKNIRPEVIIVARGGGSIEDLWPFNEDLVVRAAAKSAIPIISAIGHETDNSLIDYVSDMRAPTPTAAAEFAVPVKYEVELKIIEKSKLLNHYFVKLIAEKIHHLEMLKKNLTSPKNEIINFSQKLDIYFIRMENNLHKYLNNMNNKIVSVASSIPDLSKVIDVIKVNFDNKIFRFENVFEIQATSYNHKLEKIAAKLNAKNIEDKIGHYQCLLENIVNRLKVFGDNYGKTYFSDLQTWCNLLESYSYRKTLERGYAVIMDEEGEIINDQKKLQQQKELKILLKDGLGIFKKND